MSASKFRTLAIRRQMILMDINDVRDAEEAKRGKADDDDWRH